MAHRPAGNQATAYDVAGMFLRALGAPDTPSMRRAVAIWLRFEGGTHITGNNPWNLHSGPDCSSSNGYCPGKGSLPGQVGNRYAGTGDRNVAVFATLQDGVNASAARLITLSGHYGYGAVVAEARAGNAVGFLVALQNSSWSARHYGYSKLTGAYASSFNYNNVLSFSTGTGSASGNGGVVLADYHQPPALISFYVDEWLALNHKTRSDKITEADLASYLAFVAVKAKQPPDEFVKQLRSGGIFAWADGTKTWAAFATTNSEQKPNPNTDLLAGVGKMVAFFLDVQNLAYIMLLAGGSVLAFYGFALLVSVDGPPSVALENPITNKPSPPQRSVSVTKRDKKGQTVTETQTK